MAPEGTTIIAGATPVGAAPDAYRGAFVRLTAQGKVDPDLGLASPPDGTTPTRGWGYYLAVKTPPSGMCPGETLIVATHRGGFLFQQ